MLITLLQEQGVPYQYEGSAAARGFIELTCPRCQGNKYLGISINGRTAICWRCGKLRATEILSELLHISPTELYRLLDKMIDSPPYKIKHEGIYKPPPEVGPLLKAHKEFLRSRNLKVKDCVRWFKIKGIGIAARLSWSIFFPLTSHGQEVSWTTRSISGKRYINAKADEEAVSSRDLLFGEGAGNPHTTIICEGPLDAMRIGPGGMATLGVNVSAAQVYRISCYPRRIILFDAEPEAQRRACNLAEHLSQFKGETLVASLDSAKDASRASDKEIKQLRRSFLEC